MLHKVGLLGTKHARTQARAALRRQAKNEGAQRAPFCGNWLFYTGSPHITSPARLTVFSLGCTRPPRRGFGWCQAPAEPDTRPAEHTSELQSLMRMSYAVFCLQNNTRLRRSAQQD